MRNIRKIGAILMALITTMAIAGCSNSPAQTIGDSTSVSESNSDSSTTSSGTTTATPYDDAEEKIAAIKNARVGDTIAFNDYWLFTQSDGTKVYYADGAYAFVYNTVVIETRQAINVADGNASINDILELDDDFRLKTDLTYHFYNASDEPVSYSGDSRLTSEIKYCLVEYVDWTDEEKTQGYYYSYIFTYGDAPVKMCSVYVKPEDTENSSGTTTSESTTTPSESTTTPSESTTTPSEDTSEESTTE